jgi:hypothetical protein
MTEGVQNEMVQLLKQIVERSLKPTRSGVLLERGFRCVFCEDFGPTPQQLRHRVGCVVAHAQRLLKVVG